MLKPKMQTIVCFTKNRVADSQFKALAKGQISHFINKNVKC